MGELGSIWLYQEDEADDLKQKLQSTRLELEAVRLEVNAAKEHTREKEEQLQSLLQMVCKERDEAREQLHNLLHKINPTPKLSAAQPHLVMIPNPNNKIISSDASGLFVKHQLNPRANSSITESNTSSDPCYNNLNSNSYISSSSVDSIFDAVTSPEFSTLNNMGESGSNVGFVSQQTFTQELGQTQVQTRTHSMLPDHAMVVIDGLVKGKALPQKGKLLEAVMEAGPLLQTLILAGPLPRWRNPPPLQSFSTPQAAAIITGTSDYSYVAPMTPSWSTNTPFSQMSCGSSSHMRVNSMLNFSNGGGNGTSLGMGALGQVFNQFAVGKRQRLM